MTSRRGLIAACLLVFGSAIAGAAHAGVFRCGFTDSIPGGLPTSSAEVFLNYRFEERLYSTLRSRDLEFFWPYEYDNSLTSQVKQTLEQYAYSLVNKYQGSNALGYDMSRFQFVYNYCRRPSQPGPYNDETSSDTMSVAFGDSAWMSWLALPECTSGVPCYMPSDRCHAGAACRPVG